MKIDRWLALAFLAITVLPASAQTLPVQVIGQVSHTGLHPLVDGSRVSDALKKAKPAQDAYLLGGALLRHADRVEQTRLKAGVLFDIDALIARDGTDWRPLRDWIASMPVTGRVTARFDLRRLEIDRSIDLSLRSGDTIVLPPRPDHVSVSGVVEIECRLAYEPDRLADFFASQCKSMKMANHDWAYVIQPDGKIHRVGIGLWNRTDSIRVAPGATVLIAFKESVLGKDFPALNNELAQLVSTQLLPVSER